MKENWTDFEKFVFKELKAVSNEINKISNEIAELKGRAAAWGAVAGVVAACLGDFLLKFLHVR